MGAHCKALEGETYKQRFKEHRVLSASPSLRLPFQVDPPPPLPLLPAGADYIAEVSEAIR